MLPVPVSALPKSWSISFYDSVSLHHLCVRKWGYSSTYPVNIIQRIHWTTAYKGSRRTIARGQEWADCTSRIAALRNHTRRWRDATGGRDWEAIRCRLHVGTR